MSEVQEEEQKCPAALTGPPHTHEPTHIPADKSHHMADASISGEGNIHYFQQKELQSHTQSLLSEPGHGVSAVDSGFAPLNFTSDPDTYPKTEGALIRGLGGHEW